MAGMTYVKARVLDLFAGSGWGVACQRLGLEEFGVEIMPEAVETRAANGMVTIYNDVWDGLIGDVPTPEYEILIASPPCQTFSVAGHGTGRDALDQVLAAIDSGAYKDARKLHELGENTDMRTALVLTPLAHVWRDRPTYVLLEQVPPVLPVWQACVSELDKLGYSAWAGNLYAEQYGVPQTRKRAVLIARRDGVHAQPPEPTHSKYHRANPEMVDIGVQRWVSMSDALGIQGDYEFISNNKFANSARRHIDHPAPTITAGHDSGNRVIVGWGFKNRPAITVSNAVGRGLQGGSGGRQTIATAIKDGSFIPSPHATDDSYAESTRITVSEAAVLQSYPSDFKWGGSKTKQFLQIGNAVPPLLAEALLKEVLNERKA
jgi:DNA (cytosine-5)-methyltransferase 1